MPDEMKGRRPGENRLLAALPVHEQERLLTRWERVSLAMAEPLIEPGARIEHVYFPLSGMYSMVVTMEDGSAVEVSTVGHEGLIGLPIFLGAECSPTKVFCQIPGEVLRMGVEVFREEVGRGGALAILILRYTQAALNQIAQSAACNRLHSVEQRMGRWLLMAHDRVEADEFPLTQQFLSEMLGVRRPSVSAGAAKLQGAGLIRYHRGRITVLERAGLEAASCECYRVVKREYDRLLGEGPAA
jgi:CRP-like cAMP-binding protein